MPLRFYFTKKRFNNWLTLGTIKKWVMQHQGSTMSNNLETATLEEKKREKETLEVPSYRKGKRNFSRSSDFF